MRPVPAEVAARWGAMWAKGHVPDRPWWSRVLLTYQRCDGIVIGNESILRACGNDPRGAWDGKEPYEDAMARIDAAHPLPAPPSMPAQVWAWPHDASGRAVVHEQTVVDVSQGAVIFRDGAFYVWPPRRAILVAGPTPWGRDVPWSPA